MRHELHVGVTDPQFNPSGPRVRIPRRNVAPIPIPIRMDRSRPLMPRRTIPHQGGSARHWLGRAHLNAAEHFDVEFANWFADIRMRAAQ
jgi:hypothetical protein